VQVAALAAGGRATRGPRGAFPCAPIRRPTSCP
jgi:hypothetical protein